MKLVAERDARGLPPFSVTFSLSSLRPLPAAHHRCSFFPCFFVRLGQVLAELLQQRPTGGKRAKDETRDRDEKRQRGSRYLILPSLAHPRQEINREGLVLSLTPLPLSPVLSACVSVSPVFLLRAYPIFPYRSRGIGRSKFRNGRAVVCPRPCLGFPSLPSVTRRPLIPTIGSTFCFVILATNLVTIVVSVLDLLPLLLETRSIDDTFDAPYCLVCPR